MKCHLLKIIGSRRYLWIILHRAWNIFSWPAYLTLGILNLFRRKIEGKFRPNSIGHRKTEIAAARKTKLD